MNFEALSNLNLETIAKKTWVLSHTLNKFITYTYDNFGKLYKDQDKLASELKTERERNEEALKIIISVGKQVERLEKIVAAQEKTIASLSNRLDRSL